jgi:8-oxo-dGTP pyrophosphatase MutT (NUDIX family)
VQKIDKMELMNGPWKIKSSRSVYQDDFFEVNQDEVIRPDGEPGTYATIQMKPGVAILPLDEDGQTVFLTSQFRYAMGQYSVEVVCGGIDEGENSLEAAQRELQEEVGIRAEDWTHLGQFELDTSILQNPIDLFICRKLHFTEKNPEGSETVQTLKTSLSEIVSMVMDGRIKHGPSCVLILKAHLYLEAQQTRQAPSIPVTDISTNG